MFTGSGMPDPVNMYAIPARVGKIMNEMQNITEDFHLGTGWPSIKRLFLAGTAGLGKDSCPNAPVNYCYGRSSSDAIDLPVNEICDAVTDDCTTIHQCEKAVI